MDKSYLVQLRQRCEEAQRNGAVNIAVSVTLLIELLQAILTTERT